MTKKILSTAFFAFVLLLGLGYASSAEAFSLKLPAFMDGQRSGREREREAGDDRKGPRSLLEQKNEDKDDDERPGVRMMVGKGITGTVTAVTASSITVDGKHASTTGVFTVDVTGAKFFKNSATTTLSSILVGDTVFVEGRVSGSSATAVAVYDGKLPLALQKAQIMREEKKDDWREKREDRIADHVRGSAILGIVTNINGNILIVDGKMGTSTATTTYTVDATNSKIFKDKATTTISAILTGDRVLVEGSISGTNVTANYIFEGKLPLNGKAINAFLEEPVRGKFIEKINNFFKKFFRRDR